MKSVLFDECKWFINSFALTGPLTWTPLLFGRATQDIADTKQLNNFEYIKCKEKKFKYIEINYLNYNLCEQSVW